MGDRGSTARVALTIGACGALLWWLRRGVLGGPGIGGGDPGRGGAAIPADQDLPEFPSAPAPSAPPALLPEIRVRIHGGERLDLDGIPSDLAGVLAAARRASGVIVHATGDAQHDFVLRVIGALARENVRVMEEPPPGDHSPTIGPPVTSVGRSRRSR